MSYQVTIEPLGVTIDVRGDQTLLDAALRQGIYLPHACGHGLCATCKVAVLDGQVDQGDASPFALMDFERDDGQCLACCARPQSDLTIEADVEEDPDARHFPVRDFRATVTEVEQLTPTIRRLELSLEAPLAFQAGQYVMLTLPVDGGIRRAFSPANPPSQSSTLSLHVRAVPDGVGTGYIHQQLKVGDTLALSAPYGRFFVRDSSSLPLIFLAGGTGLAAVLSMIDDLLERDDPRPITLVYGQRHRAELYYDAELRERASRHPRFTYVSGLSDEPADSDWQGERGHVHEVAQRHFQGSFAGHRAYLCGPPVMVEACIRALMQGRLFERDIFMEKFLHAGDAQRSASPLFRNI